MVTYAEEKLTDEFIEEWTPLLVQHKEEICLHEDFDYAPAWGTYKRMSEMGMLKLYTAREEGRLIGYTLFQVAPNLHYSMVLHAVQDVVYLHPDYRGKLVGVKLIKYSDDKLRGFGVKLVSQHVKCNNDFGPMLERIGYVQAEKIYERRLDK